MPLRRIFATTCFATPLLTLLVLFLVASPAPAGDWPQILGPDRDGRAQDEKLAASWPAAGPQLLWQRPVGRGFAGVAVQGERVMLFHRIGDQEVVEALAASTGKPIWKQSFDARYVPQIFRDKDGPLCVPLVHGESVFVYGGGGDLHALNLADGKHLWSRALYEEFRTRGGQVDYGYFGAGSTPIVAGGKLLVNAGGFKGHGIMALDLDSGKTVWAVTDELPSYSAPTVATVDGVQHVIFVTRLNCVSIDPANGAERFRFRFGARGPTVNGATPLVVGNRLFVSSSYGVGAVMAEFQPDSVREIWANDDVMSSQYSTCVYRDGYLYGVDGRADVGAGTLRCIELKTGRVAWSKEDFGVASLILADDKLLILKDSGELVLAGATPEGFKSFASARIFDETVRALPALAGGKLFARDESTLKCFQVD